MITITYVYVLNNRNIIHLNINVQEDSDECQSHVDDHIALFFNSLYFLVMLLYLFIPLVFHLFNLIRAN